MRERPKKTIFPKSKQKTILKEVQKFISENLPPSKIYQKKLFGSLAKGTFGKYEKPWKNRTFSDVDVLFVVEDNFKPPKKWKLHFKPEDGLMRVYEIATISIEDVKVDVQYIIFPKTYASLKKTKDFAEKWGIPLKKDSKHKFLT